jgi:RNA polymerase sigma-70 factor (ECF subfamily)
MRTLATRVNRQPAVANYVKAPGADHYRALALDVLRIEDGAIADITTFDGRLFASLGLPTRL